MNLAVIPARGGSKRIPRKNVRPFDGIPMLARAIATARDSGLFERVIVSTDDREIADLAVRHGADVPFIRPPELANDTAGTAPVVAHATAMMANPAIRPLYVCCIYPCTPFLRAGDLVAGFELISARGEDFVYPVMEYVHPAFRAMRRTSEGKMEFLFPHCEDMRTQDLDSTYHDAGQFYWGKAEAWLSGRPMHTAGMGMVVPAWRFVDIDTEDDWHRAELIYRTMQANNFA